MNSTIQTTLSPDFFVQLQLKSWAAHIDRVTELLGKLSDETLQREIVPGKNTGVYVLGHLVGVHDAMLPLLGLGDAQYPDLYKVFVKSPDKSGFTFPSIQELKTKWKEVNDNLTEKLNTLTAEDWFSRHTAVSAEDFAREPHRNKLNIIISRTTHLAYHYGQLAFLK